MRINATLVAAIAALVPATDAASATYQLDPISLACTTDCNNFGPNPNGVVTLSGTVTTDDDSGVIGLSSIVDFNFVFDGAENAALSFTPTAAGNLPFSSLFGPLVFIDAPLSAGGNVEIFADGTDFEIRVGSNGPNSTSIFRFVVNAGIDFGFGVIPGSPVAQFFFQATTDTNGVTSFDRSVFYNDFTLDPISALLVADTGVDSPVPPDGILRFGGSVIDSNNGGGGVGVVPLPAGAALLLTALGGLALVRRRR